MKNAIIFSKVDREDGWVCASIILPVSTKGSYEDAYNEVKDKLESEDTLKYVIDERCVYSDYCDGDESFKFVTTEWSDYKLQYVFENPDEEIVKVPFSVDFGYIPSN